MAHLTKNVRKKINKVAKGSNNQLCPLTGTKHKIVAGKVNYGCIKPRTELSKDNEKIIMQYSPHCWDPNLPKDYQFIDHDDNSNQKAKHNTPVRHPTWDDYIKSETEDE